ALKYHFETAIATREWWKEKKLELTCQCGKCAYCASTQSGCCNRLDKETSGVMIVAKTSKGFTEIRRQFASKHSLESGGTEKYYLALARGEVRLPERPLKKGNSEAWLHEPVEDKLGRRGRIDVALTFDKKKWRSLPWDDGAEKSQEEEKVQTKGWVNSSAGDDANHDGGAVGEGGRQNALTLYQPVAWFSSMDGEEKYTLLHIQIITGRTHQIRFHCAEIGHPLVGDPTYGAPWSERQWAKRVFLHSYQTKFREPFTMRWFEATSPLPEDLGKTLCTLKLDQINEPMMDHFLSRRQHDKLAGFLKQYSGNQDLLITHDAPVNAAQLFAAAQATAMAAAQATAKAQWDQSRTTPSTGGAAPAAGGSNWTCPSCNNDNFPLRMSCNRCKLPKMGGGMGGGMGMQAMTAASAAGGSNWTCPSCNNVNFPLRSSCNRCKLPKMGGGMGMQAMTAAPAVGGVSSSSAWNTSSPSTWTSPQRGGKDAWKPDKSGGQGAWQPDKAWSADRNSGGNWKNADWKSNSDWKSDGGWKNGKGGGAPVDNQRNGNSWQAPSSGKASAAAEADDDDDAWGAWTAPKVETPPPAAPSAPEERPDQQAAAKRPRLEEKAPEPPVPPQIAGRVPSTPPAVEQQPQVAPQPAWQRMESRSKPGIFYYWNQLTGVAEAEPPPPWEKKQSRSNASVFYYWNTVTSQSSVEKPPY
ncbi:unnamed protein product, partial [Polarella glacialis]